MRPTIRALLIASASLFALPATAQTVTAADPQGADPQVAEETQNDVIVVARKREERLVDVPIAVTAISAESLAKLQAVDLGGIQGAVPNVNLVQGRGSSSNANIFIRGVGQPDALQTFDPAVGIYADGVYFSRIQGALFNLFDVDHVEVLRGPQGTLYGKNTIGGAVNVVSRKPDPTTAKVLANFTYGSYDQLLGNAYVSVPIVEGKVALSIAGVYDKRDGTVVDPLTGRRYNDRNTQAGRIILRATPTDRLEMIASADYTRQRTQPTLGYATAPIRGLLGFPVIKPAYPYGPYNYRASTSLRPGQGQELDHFGFALTLNYELSDAFTISSITSARKLRPNFFIDFDATEQQVADAFVGVVQKQFSQELQLKYDSGALNGVFGVYFLNEAVKSNQVSYDDNLVYLAPAGPPVTFVRFINDDQNTKSYAAFGQLTYDLTERFSVTGGLRYTKEDKRYNRFTSVRSSFAALNSSFAFPGGLAAPFNADNTVSFDAWTPSATLSFKLTRDTLLYASAARGFKSGGFNGRVNSAADVTQIVNGVATIVPFFRPETVWTYEAGAKGNFLNGRVQLAADVFYSDYRDFQARVGGGTTTLAANGSFPVLNAGKLRNWGIEAEMTVKPTRAWTIRGTFGYLNSKYLRFDDGRRTAPAGSDAFSCNPTGRQIVCEPAFSPPISASLATDYAIPVGESSLTLGGDVRFVDEQYLSVDNRENLKEKGYGLLNAFVQYDAPGGKFYLRGGVKNLTKQIYLTDAQEFSSIGNIQTAYYGDPRTWTGTVGIRF